MCFELEGAPVLFVRRKRRIRNQITWHLHFFFLCSISVPVMNCLIHAIFCILKDQMHRPYKQNTFHTRKKGHAFKCAININI